MATNGEFALGDYLRVIFKRKTLIVGIFLTISVGIGFSVFRQPLLYEVSGKFLVTRARGEMVLTPAATGAGPGFILPQQQDLTAEVELLKSRSLSKAVAEELNRDRPAQASADKTPVMLASLMQVPASLTT